MLLAFTGQKLIDNYSIISNVGNNSGIQNIYDPEGQRAISSNDISRRLVVSGTYQLPFGHGRQFGHGWNGFINAIAGGWEVNGIASYQTGFPLAVTTQNTSNSGSTSLRPDNSGQSAALDGSVAARFNGYLDAEPIFPTCAFHIRKYRSNTARCSGSGPGERRLVALQKFYPQGTVDGTIPGGGI